MSESHPPSYLRPPSAPWRSWRPAPTEPQASKPIETVRSALRSTCRVIRVPPPPPETVLAEVELARPELAPWIELWRSMGRSDRDATRRAEERIATEEARGPRIPSTSTHEEDGSKEIVDAYLAPYVPASPSHSPEAAAEAAWRLSTMHDTPAFETVVAMDPLGSSQRLELARHMGIRSAVFHDSLYFRPSRDGSIAVDVVEGKGRLAPRGYLQTDDSGRVWHDDEAWRDFAFPKSPWLVSNVVSTYEVTVSREETLFCSKLHHLVVVLLAQARDGRTCALVRKEWSDPFPILVDLRDVADIPSAAAAWCRAAWHADPGSFHVEFGRPDAGRQTFVVHAGFVVASVSGAGAEGRGRGRLDRRVREVHPDGDRWREDVPVATALARHARRFASATRKEPASLEIDVAMSDEGPCVVSIRRSVEAWSELPAGVVSGFRETARRRVIGEFVAFVEDEIAVRGLRGDVGRIFANGPTGPDAVREAFRSIEVDEALEHLARRFVDPSLPVETPPPVPVVGPRTDEWRRCERLVESFLTDGRVLFTLPMTHHDGKRFLLAFVAIPADGGREWIEAIRVRLDASGVEVQLVGDDWFVELPDFLDRRRLDDGGDQGTNTGLCYGGSIGSGFSLVVYEGTDLRSLRVRVLRGEDGDRTFGSLAAATVASIVVETGPLETEGSSIWVDGGLRYGGSDSSPRGHSIGADFLALEPEMETV